MAALAIAAVALPSATAAGGEPSKPVPAVLRGNAVVAGPVLRLGDIFLNVGDKADQRVANAPAPGTSMTLGAPVLGRLARAFGLTWQPASPQDQVVIERQSQVIGAEDIDRLIRAALAEKGVDTARMTVELNGTAPRLVIAAEANAAVESLNYQPSTRRFTAVITTSGNAQPVQAASNQPPSQPLTSQQVTSQPLTSQAMAQRLPLSGLLTQSVDVPVLVRRMQPGEIISERDLQWMRANDRRLPANAVLDPAALVGNTLRRGIDAGAPVPFNDLRRPIAVGKGALVTMIVSGPFMQLTARGRAMHDAAVGDSLRVLNEASRSIVEGIVGANGQVMIATGPAPAAASMPAATARRVLN